MEHINNNREPGIYDTAINIIGSVKDSNYLIMAIESHFSQVDTLEDLILQRNEFNIRTDKSRARIEREIKKVFIKFYNQEHQDLIGSIFSERVPLQDKHLFLIWQFALNNRLFREITLGVFIKVYLSGRVSITKEDIIAYLKELLRQNESLELGWSQSTIKIISTKYLSYMSKMGVVSPGRVRTFNHVRPSTEAQVIFLYFAQLYAPHVNNILDNELLPISFIPLGDFHEKMKKLSMRGFFNMDFNGSDLKIELTHSYKGVCDVLYN